MNANENQSLDLSMHEVEVFSNFCDFIETTQFSDEIEFLQILRDQLLLLYFTGLKLPHDMMSDGKEYADPFNREEFKTRLIFFQNMLKKHRFYWYIFDPSDEADTEAVCGDLVDDLEDIYIDLKRTVLLYSLDSKEAKTKAIWQFKFLFNAHWGDHCMNALNACHYILNQRESTL